MYVYKCSNWSIIRFIWSYWLCNNCLNCLVAKEFIKLKSIIREVYIIPPRAHQKVRPLLTSITNMTICACGETVACATFISAYYQAVVRRLRQTSLFLFYMKTFTSIWSFANTSKHSFCPKNSGFQRYIMQIIGQGMS